MTFLEMWKAWQRKARAFTDYQPQRRGVQQRHPLLLEALEDRLLLSNSLSPPRDGLFGADLAAFRDKPAARARGFFAGRERIVD